MNDEIKNKTVSDEEMNEVKKDSADREVDIDEMEDVSGGTTLYGTYVRDPSGGRHGGFA